MVVSWSISFLATVTMLGLIQLKTGDFWTNALGSSTA